MHHDADQADTTALAGGYYKGGYNNTCTPSSILEWVEFQLTTLGTVASYELYLIKMP